MELSAKAFLELEEKLELKKYNLATHYGVDPNEITPKLVKPFDREKPRTVWYNTVKALPLDMKLHDGILDWRSKSAWDIMNSIDLKRQSPNIIMCLLAMDSLNDVMPQTKGLKFTKSVQYFAGAKTSRKVLEAGLNKFIPLIRHHKEMASQMFDIEISVIKSNWQTFKEKLALTNATFRKTFGLNQPKPLAPVLEPLLTPVPETTLDTKPFDPMSNIPHIMDNIMHPDNIPLSPGDHRQSAPIYSKALIASQLV